LKPKQLSTNANKSTPEFNASNIPMTSNQSENTEDDTLNLKFQGLVKKRNSIVPPLSSTIVNTDVQMSPNKVEQEVIAVALRSAYLEAEKKKEIERLKKLEDERKASEASGKSSDLVLQPTVPSTPLSYYNSSILTLSYVIFILLSHQPDHPT
jgi:hypothetical protein